MSQVKFYRGAEALYTGNTAKYADCIYFATDTHLIYMGGKAYGFNPANVDAVKDVAYANGVFTISYIDGTTEDKTITLKAADIAIDDTAGLIDGTNVETALAELAKKTVKDADSENESMTVEETTVGGKQVMRVKVTDKDGNVKTYITPLTEIITPNTIVLGDIASPTYITGNSFTFTEKATNNTEGAEARYTVGIGTAAAAPTDASTLAGTAETLTFSASNITFTNTSDGTPATQTINIKFKAFLNGEESEVAEKTYTVTRQVAAPSKVTVGGNEYAMSRSVTATAVSGGTLTYGVGSTAAAAASASHGSTGTLTAAAESLNGTTVYYDVVQSKTGGYATNKATGSAVVGKISAYCGTSTIESVSADNIETLKGELTKMNNNKPATCTCPLKNGGYNWFILPSNVSLAAVWQDDSNLAIYLANTDNFGVLATVVGNYKCYRFKSAQGAENSWGLKYVGTKYGNIQY